MSKKGNLITVIYCSEDGDHTISVRDKDEFLKELADEAKSGIEPEFLSAENCADLDNFSGYIVIDGPIVVPKAKTVATSWEL